MLSSLSHPRKRTVSIGPQSQADVHEAIAVRQRKRRDSEAIEQKLPDPAIENHVVSKTNETHEHDTKSSTFPPVIDTEEEDAMLFQTLPKTRVRYDVEVVTKLIVYTGGGFFVVSLTILLLTRTGIAWLATEGDPILFEHIGLGMGIRP